MSIYNSQNDFRKNLIQRCINIANAFDKFQRMRSDDIKEEDLDIDIVLPYIILHAKDNRTIFKKFQNKSPSFRIRSMISIFNSKEEPVEISNFFNLNLDSFTDGQKLTLFKNDINRVMQGEDPTVFSLNNFSRYLSDIFPIFYNRYKSEFPFSAFVRVLKYMSENASLATCFAFPQFIMPVFNRSYSQTLNAQLSVMSAALRPILLDKLMIDPYIRCALIIEFLGKQAPEYLLQTFNFDFKGLSEPMQPLIRATYNSKAYYLCFARYCACRDRSILDSEANKILKCKDSKLLAALFFHLSSISINAMNQIVDRFLQDKDSFIDLMTLFSLVAFDEYESVSNMIGQYLGPECSDSNKGLPFYQQLLSRTHQLINYLSQNALDHPKALIFIGSLMPNNAEDLKDMIAPAMYALKTVTNHDIATLYKFIDKFGHKDQIPDVIEDIINQKLFFEIDDIRKNPAPAVAASMLILHIPQKNKIQLLIQKIPIRLVLSACNNYEFYYNFCQEVTKILSFAEEPFLSLKMDDIKPTTPLLQLLNIIKNNPTEISEETLNEWRIHHFLNSFHFVIQTMQSFGAPMNLSNLQFVFDLDSSILSNKNALKIIFICVLDIISFDNTVDPQSIYLLFFESISHFADSRIDKETIGWFVGVILGIPRFFFSLLDRGIKDTVLAEFGEYVKLTNPMVDIMKKAAENLAISKLLNIIKIANAFIKQSPQNVIIPVIAIITRLNKVIFEGKENTNIELTPEWIVEFCTNLSNIAIMIPSVHSQILTTMTRFTEFYENMLSEDAILQIIKLKNSMTSSLFEI